MTKEDGLLELTRIIKDDVRHKDYDRVVELADLYYKFVSGDRLSEELQKITKRETDDEYDMRKSITNSIIPPTLSSTKLPFQKAVRSKPLVRKIDWDTKNTDEKKAEFEEFINKYWGDASLEKFFEYAYVDYNYIDPNAFLITEFDEFNPQKEKARPYPFIATSEQCIMFNIKNNILQYLVVQLPIKFLLKDVEMEGFKYTLYLGKDTIQFIQIGERNDESEVVEIDKKFYQVLYFQPMAVKVPARRFGYKRDAETQGRTFISCYHDVIPYLKKTLKLDSELDLTTALTAFPQRFAYVAPCNHCNKGVMPDESICTVCNGTGKEPFHNSVMDVITLDLPREASDIIDLEKLMVYKSPPTELLNFQKDYIADLRASVFLMMFNKELLTKNELANTATEVTITQDNLNDTLRPFAQALSTMWEFVVTDIATFTDFGDKLIIEHQYPSDFKFKSVPELMAELLAAKNAGASTSTIAAIEDDINELLYSDRPEELKIIRVKNSFNPFRGYSEENVRLLVSQGMTTEYNTIKWANLESIFNDLETENESPWLYDLVYELIAKKVDEKVKLYMAQIKAEVPPEPVNPFTIPQ